MGLELGSTLSGCSCSTQPKEAGRQVDQSRGSGVSSPASDSIHKIRRFEHPEAKVVAANLRAQALSAADTRWVVMGEGFGLA